MSIKPKSLKPGDTIGIVSPASPIGEKYTDFFNNGILYLKKRGYNIVFGKSVHNDIGYLAGTEKERAYDLMDMFENKKINAIFCSRGGYGCERLTEHLDIEIIKNNPKIFAGYSNISFLLNIFYQYANFITFHGPMIVNIGEQALENNTKHLLQTLSFSQRRYIISRQPSPGHFLSSSKAQGTLIGGNLTTFAGTIGTKYEIDTTNCILFLEEVNEEAYKIDRMITLLKNAGKLDTCSGFILGDFTNCNDSSGKNVLDVISDLIFPLGKPVIYSFKCGHGPVKPTLPIGAIAQIDAEFGIVKILEPVVR